MHFSLLDFLDESRQYGGSRATYRQARTKDQEMEIAASSPIFVKLKYKGWLINPSIHAAAQAFERRPDMELDDWKTMHKRAMAYLLQQDDVRRGEYLFFSKQLNQGYVVGADFNKKEMRIITVLPRGRKNPKPGTKQIIVEGRVIQIEIVEID